MKRERLFEEKGKSFYVSHLKKLYMGHLKMVPPQQQEEEEEEEEQRFPLPDLSASPQIKTIFQVIELLLCCVEIVYGTVSANSLCQHLLM